MAKLNTTAAKMHAKSVQHRPATSGNKNVVSSARRVANPDMAIDRIMQPHIKGPGNDGC